VITAESSKRPTSSEVPNPKLQRNSKSEVPRIQPWSRWWS
jgi:hypothetical protein